MSMQMTWTTEAANFNFKKVKQNQAFGSVLAVSLCCVWPPVIDNITVVFACVTSAVLKRKLHHFMASQSTLRDSLCLRDLIIYCNLISAKVEYWAP